MLGTQSPRIQFICPETQGENIGFRQVSKRRSPPAPAKGTAASRRACEFADVQYPTHAIPSFQALGEVARRRIGLKEVSAAYTEGIANDHEIFSAEYKVWCLCYRVTLCDSLVRALRKGHR